MSSIDIGMNFRSFLLSLPRSRSVVLCYKFQLFDISVQVGNIGGRDFAESLAPDVQKLLVSQYL